MRTSSLRLSLLAAIVASAAVRSAGAQQVAALDRSHPATLPASDVRPIATYHFTGWRGSNLPVEVSVADSAGTIVAGFRTSRNSAIRPLAINVHGGDVVLQGMTPAGQLTLELYEQLTESEYALIGRWTLGSQVGELRGRFTPPAVAVAQP